MKDAGNWRAGPAPAEHVELRRDRDGLWRWRFRSLPHGVLLEGNESYPDREDAVRAATVAYPGTPLLEPPAPDGAGPRWSRRRSAAVAAVSLVMVVLLVVLTAGAGALIAASLGWRGLRRRLSLS